MALEKDTATAQPEGPSRTGLPAQRAFALQLRADADPARGIVSGRIEHMVSGAAALFESVEQLADWIRDVIARSTKSSDQ
jgi:hypothetical protein